MQKVEPVPHHPHCEQQYKGLAQTPFPIAPLPHVPPAVGRVAACVGAGDGAERVG